MVSMNEFFDQFMIKKNETWLMQRSIIHLKPDNLIKLQ